MSWNDYITNRLISSVDSNNHILENVVEEACIINKSDGIEWASTPNFSIDKREVTIEEIGEKTIKKNDAGQKKRSKRITADRKAIKMKNSRTEKR